MAFDDPELQEIEAVVGAFCANRVPEHVRDKVRMEYRIDGQSVTIIEMRPHWEDPSEWIDSPIARLRYVRTDNLWELYWMPSNLKWKSYDPLPVSQDLTELVHEIDRDPVCCFFG